MPDDKKTEPEKTFEDLLDGARAAVDALEEANESAIEAAIQDTEDGARSWDRTEAEKRFLAIRDMADAIDQRAWTAEEAAELLGAVQDISRLAQEGYDAC